MNPPTPFGEGIVGEGFGISKQPQPKVAYGSMTLPQPVRETRTNRGGRRFHLLRKRQQQRPRLLQTEGREL